MVTSAGNCTETIRWLTASALRHHEAAPVAISRTPVPWVNRRASDRLPGW
jgi:hypothetical protein